MNSTGSVPEDPIRLQGFAPKDVFNRREKIFTRYAAGFYQRIRFFSGWPLLIAYFLMPWIRLADQPALAFDLSARQIHLFGMTFFSQELMLLGWPVIIAAMGLFTLTTLVGRLWCGYTCPQTVWTAIFMWAEQITEGPGQQRVLLAQAPWSVGKIAKRTLKHSIWLVCATLTGLTFVGYFTEIGALTLNIVTFQASGQATLWVVAFSAATYFNAGWLRERVCISVCPYARLQAAMFDANTLTVSYDPGRGEPRGMRGREGEDPQASDRKSGDCIDCGLCVQVCPVGIDIRNGLQYECTGCAHCVDACAEVMQKMEYPPGLIRYTSENVLTNGATRWYRRRGVWSLAALLVLITGFAFVLSNREPFDVKVQRVRGELYQRTVEGLVTNQYEVQILNKSQSLTAYHLDVDSALPLAILSTREFTIQAGTRVNLPLILGATPESIVLANTRVTVQLCNVTTGECVADSTSFQGPLR